MRSAAIGEIAPQRLPAIEPVAVHAAMRDGRQRLGHVANAAADEALRDAGIRPEPSTGTRWGISVGAGMMGIAFDEVRKVHSFCGRNGEFAPEGFSEDGRRQLLHLRACLREPRLNLVSQRKQRFYPAHDFLLFGERR